MQELIDDETVLRGTRMPALAGLDCFSMTQMVLSRLIGVPQPKISRWYNGQSIEAEYIFLLTVTLEVMIRTADEGLRGDELAPDVKKVLEVRTENARQWLALQKELNEQLPDEAREHALAMVERQAEIHRTQQGASAATVREGGARPLAGQQ